MCPTGGSLSVSLGKTAAGLINNLLHADQKIVGQNKTYHGHKVILKPRSKKWGQDNDLAGSSVLCHLMKSVLFSTNVGLSFLFFRGK